MNGSLGTIDRPSNLYLEEAREWEEALRKSLAGLPGCARRGSIVFGRLLAAAARVSPEPAPRAQPARSASRVLCPCVVMKQHKKKLIRSREHQKQKESSDETVKENEEWSKFKDLTTGVDSVLKKTQGDLDRIKSTSFFQRIPAGTKEREPVEKEEPKRPVVEITEADFPQLAAAAAAAGSRHAVERGEVKLAYVPDSPEEFRDDDIFDTSHVDALIKGQESKTPKGKKGVDIGVAVEVLTGRIDNLTITSTKRSKRVIPGDLLLESVDKDNLPVVTSTVVEPEEKSILDIDADIPITSPIDLSVSLHTTLIQQNKSISQEELFASCADAKNNTEEETEVDEFTLLAAESLEVKTVVKKIEESEIKLEPVLQETWSAFEADKSDTVFAEGIVEDQLDAEISKNKSIKSALLEDDDDFDPRADEVKLILNNRRKSSVRIHITNPSGLRESITSDDIVDSGDSQIHRDLLGGSTTDLTQLGDSVLEPVDVNDSEIDPFDTTIVDKIVAPGKVELKLLEEELIGAVSSVPIYRVPSDPDFDPRADEPKKSERRASRPENLTVSKSVVFNVDGETISELDSQGKSKPVKPVTPYYNRELSITEDINEDSEVTDKPSKTLTRTRSEEEFTSSISHQTKRRHSEFPQQNKNTYKASDLLHESVKDIEVKVLTPTETKVTQKTLSKEDIDPFDTSFAINIEPSKTELKLLAKEFSCEKSSGVEGEGEPDLLEPSDDIFQVKALTPEPSDTARIPEEEFDPFDTSFANDLNPGRTEIKLLESEFLN
ncbi:unnamed protein product [Danaus chrysippus]|uniref:(African queen) hypothetical protein n=1 Tax=Danaus chrysippus TaxID=151541 RepID=A0A8J2R666_9NEOP|nr:unnamed protein product [Danaus chrysippus]